MVEYLVVCFSSVRRPGSDLPGLQHAFGIVEEHQHRELFEIVVGHVGGGVHQDGGFVGNDVEDLRVVDPHRGVGRLDDGRGGLTGCSGKP